MERGFRDFVWILIGISKEGRMGFGAIVVVRGGRAGWRGMGLRAGGLGFRRGGAGPMVGEVG